MSEEVAPTLPVRARFLRVLDAGIACGHLSPAEALDLLLKVDDWGRLHRGRDEHGWFCSECHRRVFLAQVWDDRVVCSDCSTSEAPR